MTRWVQIVKDFVAKVEPEWQEGLRCCLLEKGALDPEFVLHISSCTNCVKSLVDFFEECREIREEIAERIQKAALN